MTDKSDNECITLLKELRLSQLHMRMTEYRSIPLLFNVRLNAVRRWLGGGLEVVGVRVRVGGVRVRVRGGGCRRNWGW